MATYPIYNPASLSSVYRGLLNASSAARPQLNQPTLASQGNYRNLGTSGAGTVPASITSGYNQAASSTPGYTPSGRNLAFTGPTGSYMKDPTSLPQYLNIFDPASSQQMGEFNALTWSPQVTQALASIGITPQSYGAQQYQNALGRIQNFAASPITSQPVYRGGVYSGNQVIPKIGSQTFENLAGGLVPTGQSLGNQLQRYAQYAQQTLAQGQTPQNYGQWSSGTSQQAAEPGIDFRTLQNVVNASSFAADPTNPGTLQPTQTTQYQKPLQDMAWLTYSSNTGANPLDTNAYQAFKQQNPNATNFYNLLSATAMPTTTPQQSAAKTQAWNAAASANPAATNEFLTRTTEGANYGKPVNFGRTYSFSMG